jgi:predicted nucleotidyltransferase component of viral defense system
MDSSPASALTQLQQDLLREFFAREQRFFLTGGGALAGFYLKHRATEDLDFFAPPELDLDDAAINLREAAAACGALVESQRHAHDFHRYLIRRGGESCLVDLVVDRAPMIVSEKVRLGQMRLDPLREIAANKICTLLGRAENKDLRDVRELLGLGFDLREAMRDAERKDGGVSAATLAFLLADDAAWANSPGSDEALAEFRHRLAGEFRAIAFEQARKE